MDWRRILFFEAGLVTVWFGLESPLDRLGDDYLLSAHMVQHMLLVAYAPPLLLLGLGPDMAARIRSLPLLGALLEPVPAMVLFFAGILLWHVPFMFDATFSNASMHVAEHLTFIGIGVLYWWSAIGLTSDQNRWRLGVGGRIIYVSVGSIPMMLIALALQFSRVVFYSAYAHVPQLLPGFTPVLDQSVAGAIMFTMDMAVIAVDVGVTGYGWLNHEVGRDLRATGG